MSRITAAIAKIPITLADVLVLVGFGTALTGLWWTFGPGPTLIVGGVAVIWVGGVLSRGNS